MEVERVHQGARIMERRLEEELGERGIPVNDVRSTARNKRLATEKLLYEASLTGSVDSLKQLIAEDPLIVARAAVSCFDETPLHIAAMLGHLDFAKFVVSHKPDMATAVDSQGLSPLHLAAANGYVEIVNVLLSVNSEVCLVRDEYGRTPLDLAVMKNRVNVIEQLRYAQPDLNKYTLDHGETLLHLAVRENRLDASKLLVSILRRDHHNIVNVMDDEGNAILHIATAMKQMEAAGSPLQVASPPQNVLQEASIKAKLLPRAGSVREYQKSTENWLKENRDALLIAASVIAAMAYQAGFNPPSGVWQDDTAQHYPGTSIMADNYPGRYPWFWTFNTVSFVSSLSIIFLLISGIPLKQRIIMWILMVSMWMTITCMTLTYLISMQAISPDHELATITYMVVISVYGWLMLMSLIFLVHFIYFFMWFLQNVRQLRKQSLTPLKFVKALFLRCDHVMQGLAPPIH